MVTLELNINFIYLSSLLFGLSGYYTTIIMAVAAYLSDIVDKELLALRIGMYPSLFCVCTKAVKFVLHVKINMVFCRKCFRAQHVFYSSVGIETPYATYFYCCVRITLH